MYIWSVLVRDTIIAHSLTAFFFSPGGPLQKFVATSITHNSNQIASLVSDKGELIVLAQNQNFKK